MSEQSVRSLADSILRRQQASAADAVVKAEAVANGDAMQIDDGIESLASYMLLLLVFSLCNPCAAGAGGIVLSTTDLFARSIELDVDEEEDRAARRNRAAKQAEGG